MFKKNTLINPNFFLLTLTFYFFLNTWDALSFLFVFSYTLV